MLDRDTIRQTLIELLEADTGEKYPDLDDDSNLREGLGLDSVDVVSIVSQIERRFRIRLTQQELEKLVTDRDPEVALRAKEILTEGVSYQGEVTREVSYLLFHACASFDRKKMEQCADFCDAPCRCVWMLSI